MPSASQRGEGERFAGRPVERLLAAAISGALSSMRSIFGCGWKSVRELRLRVAAARCSRSRGDAGVDIRDAATPVRRRSLSRRRRASSCSAARSRLLRGFVELVLRAARRRSIASVGLFARDAAQLQQVLEVTFAHRLALVDRPIHHRLREAGSSPSLWP